MQAWINTEDEKSVKILAEELEKAVKADKSKTLLAFMIFVNPKKEPVEEYAKRLQKFVTDNKLEKVGVAYLPGPTDSAVEKYRINAEAKNTVFFVRESKIDRKLVNLELNESGISTLKDGIKAILPRQLGGS